MGNKLKVMNPMGYPPEISQKRLAARLDTLAGKTIYLLDCRFDDGDILIAQMANWFAEQRPDVHVEVRRKSGVYTERDEPLYREIQAGGHAAIVAVGHWSTCAPAVADQCIILETEYGVPTASVQTQIFEPLVRASCLQQGLPYLRHVFVPQPVMGQSPARLRAYIDGPDAVTGRPFMQEVFDALTKPLSAEETEQMSFSRSTPRWVDEDSEENLRQLFLENHWTDQLPIVLPTEERVAAMLAGTTHDAQEMVGRMRPTATREAWAFSVEKVAVNAVMAGARPEYFPVILALAATETSARGSTTSSAAAMAVINGPIRHEIEMNWGIGALGPYNHANATIGRAYGLLSQNLQGGSIPRVTYLGSQGNNYAYNNVTFAENEERSPWTPFHVQHGFRRSESAVSVFPGCHSTSYLLGLRETHWQEQVRYLLRGMCPYIPPTLLLDPITARLFVDRGGFDTKEKLIDWLHDNATMPAGVYWDDQLIQNYVHPRALNGVEPYATMLQAADDEMISIFPKDKIHVVVVGGETNGYWRIMGCNYARTMSIDLWR